MKIHHLFPSNNHHHVPWFIHLFNHFSVDMNIDPEDHYYVQFVRELPSPNQTQEYNYLNLLKLNTSFILGGSIAVFRYLNSIEKDDCLILHSGFGIPRIWQNLFLQRCLWKRTVWVMWGGDINQMKDISNTFTLFSKLHLWYYGKIISNLFGVSALAPEDYSIVQSLFPSCNNYVRAFYPMINDPFFTENFEHHTRSEFNPLQIFLGNSAAISNRHIEALEWLSRFKDENIRIYCPLSYGGNPEYIRQVIHTGNELFGSKFISITDLLSRKDFVQLVNNMDILFWNHKRQQGLFGIYSFICNGRVAYVRSDSSTYSMLHDFGIQVRDTLSINNISFNDFKNPWPDSICNKNIHQYKQHLSVKASIESWKFLFQSLKKIITKINATEK